MIIREIIQFCFILCSILFLGRENIFLLSIIFLRDGKEIAVREKSVLSGIRKGIPFQCREQMGWFPSNYIDESPSNTFSTPKNNIETGNGFSKVQIFSSFPFMGVKSVYPFILFSYRNAY